MGFLRELLFGKPTGAFRKVDWLDIEAKWRSVQALTQSANQADLKQAVIQADVVIDSVMRPRLSGHGLAAARA